MVLFWQKNEVYTQKINEVSRIAGKKDYCTFFPIYLPGIGASLLNQDKAYDVSAVGIEFEDNRIVRS